MLNNAEPEPKAGALVASDSRDLAVHQEQMVAIESTQTKVQRLWAKTASFKALSKNKRHAQRQAQAQHLRDAREIGQLLDELGVKQGGKRWSKSPSVILTDDPDRIPTLKELNLTARESVNSKATYAIPLEKFEIMLEREKNLSMAAFLRAAYPEQAKGKKKANKTVKSNKAQPPLDALNALALNIFVVVDRAKGIDLKAFYEAFNHNHPGKKPQQQLDAFQKLAADLAALRSAVGAK